MRFRIDVKPLSVNEAWQGRRFKTPKYNTYEKLCLTVMPEIPFDGIGQLYIFITFGLSNKLSDIDNGIKPILDILQKKYGFNDRDIYQLIVKKEIVKKGQEFIDIDIKNLIDK